MSGTVLTCQPCCLLYEWTQRSPISHAVCLDHAGVTLQCNVADQLQNEGATLCIWPSLDPVP